MARQLIVLLALIAFVSAGKKIGNNGLNLLKSAEGWRANFYYDQIGLKTIGYGHACKWHNNCNDIHPPLSQQQGTDLLKKDLVEFENCINTAAPGLSQNRFDACVDFAFNMGCGAFTSSDILKNIKSKNWSGAANSFTKYDKIGGQVIAGLTVRRRNEKNLFNKK
ncbi:unnamed protein product [Medioppia subpectinata]|uniref:Lysozyme n=1 Tax=Medioppia subpectinata TaxID=1979941 RepID=A0A7R9KT99_9ACAR|nr:unnamed protein product [Medioppia subpectinata]CAG2109473.1 unnamed protein product [Medioppia subpectinata]